MNIEYIEIIDFILKELYKKDENYGESLDRIESNFEKHNHGKVDEDLWNKIIRICENQCLLEKITNNGTYRIRPEGIEILLQHDGSYLEYWKSQNEYFKKQEEIEKLNKKVTELSITNLTIDTKLKRFQFFEKWWWLILAVLIFVGKILYDL